MKKYIQILLIVVLGLLFINTNPSSISLAKLLIVIVVIIAVTYLLVQGISRHLPHPLKLFIYGGSAAVLMSICMTSVGLGGLKESVMLVGLYLLIKFYAKHNFQKYSEQSID
jgi:hypothetical protein